MIGVQCKSIYYVCKHSTCYTYIMQTCSKCGVDKPFTDYYFRDRTNGILHKQCKDCYKERRATNYREHYQKYKLLYRLRARDRRKKTRHDLQTKMLSYLSGKSCLVCGESDPIVLEFDHINPSEKSFGIAGGIRLGYSWEKIVSEIEKCRILCANCHKKQTASQFGWYKLPKL